MLKWLDRRSRKLVVRAPRRFRPVLEALEDRCLLSITLDQPANVNVPGGKTLTIPLTASSASNAALTYSVTSSNPAVTATLHTGDPFLQFTLSSSNAQINGQTITLQLFPEYAPNTVQRITDLVNSNFYNGKSFYRIVPGFVIQGGAGNAAPAGTNSNEFNLMAIFDGTGQLAIANSGKDTDGTELFITTSTTTTAQVAQQRALDFNFTLFGQVVRGQNIVDLISQQPASGQTPITPVTITSAKIVTDNADNTLTIFAPAGQSSSISVTVSDNVAGDTPVTKSFLATAVTDTVNDPPILGSIGDQFTDENSPLTFTLSGSDLENDPLTFEALLQGASANNATVSVNGDQVFVTPKTGFSGDLSLLVGVKDAGATVRGNSSDPFDTQLIKVHVAPVHFEITAPGGVTAGTPFQFTVTALNSAGNVATNYSGTVHFFTTSDLMAHLPADVALTDGSGQFDATLETVGAQTLHVIDTASADVTGDSDLIGVNDRTFAAAADAGGASEVKVFDSITGQVRFDFLAYDAAFTGGARVAVGDLNNDGIPDIITGSGAGALPEVKVFDGVTGALIRDFFVNFQFSSAFTGGINVAVGDVDHDGFKDILVGAGNGGQPEVMVFSGKDGSVHFDFMAYPLNVGFTAGVNVALGDTNGDGFSDIITGPGNNTFVKVFSGKDGSLMQSFFAYDQAYVGGVYVASGDANGDGNADIVTGAGGTLNGPGPHTKVWDGPSGQLLQSFFPLTPNFAGGARVSMTDLNGDGRADIVVGAGPLGAPQVHAFDALTLQELDNFFAFDTNDQHGINVAGS